MPNVTLNGKVFDARPDWIDLRDREYQPRLRSLPPQYPDLAQLNKHFSNYAKADLILNQGKEGACTGFGLAAVINYLRWRQALGTNHPYRPRSVSACSIISPGIMMNGRGRIMRDPVAGER